MLMAEATDLLSDTFTAAIRAAFEHSHQLGSASKARRLAPYSRHGLHPGHNADVVPDVPPTLFRIHREFDEAAVAFTWKVEHDQPPHAILHVKKNWLKEVVRPGHVVLGRFPVLEVTGRDEHGRPTQILAVGIGGYFDTRMHGWRAHGEAIEAQITWDGPPGLSCQTCAVITTP